MIDALVSSGALAGATGPASAATPLAQANFTDVERFRAAMVSGQGMPPGAAQPQTVDTAAREALQSRALTSPANANSPSLGDTILGTLQDLSADTKQRYGQVGELLSKPDISMSELMSAQYTLLQTSLQFEIASKGISKLAQNLDSVLKTS